MEEGKLDEAYQFAEELNIDKVSSIGDLKILARVYERMGEYEMAKEILYQSYRRKPTKMVIYRLVYLCVKTEAFEDAEHFYKKFSAMAPNSPDRYILRYGIDRAKGVDYFIRIATLQKLKALDYREEWGYELAKIYHKAGLYQDCVQECDDLILWFGRGKIVEKARLLKMYHQEGKASLEEYGIFDEHLNDEEIPQKREAYGFDSKNLGEQIKEMVAHEGNTQLQEDLNRDLEKTVDLRTFMAEEAESEELDLLRREVGRGWSQPVVQESNNREDYWRDNNWNDYEADSLEEAVPSGMEEIKPDFEEAFQTEEFGEEYQVDLEDIFDETEEELFDEVYEDYQEEIYDEFQEEDQEEINDEFQEEHQEEVYDESQEESQEEVYDESQEESQEEVYDESQEESQEEVDGESQEESQEEVYDESQEENQEEVYNEDEEDIQEEIDDIPAYIQRSRDDNKRSDSKADKEGEQLLGIIRRLWPGSKNARKDEEENISSNDTVHVKTDALKNKKVAKQSVETQEAKDVAEPSVETQEAKDVAEPSVETQEAKDVAEPSVETQEGKDVAEPSVETQEAKDVAEQSVGTQETKDATEKTEEMQKENQVLVQGKEYISGEESSPEEAEKEDKLVNEIENALAQQSKEIIEQKQETKQQEQEEVQLKEEEQTVLSVEDIKGMFPDYVNDQELCQTVTEVLNKLYFGEGALNITLTCKDKNRAKKFAYHMAQVLATMGVTENEQPVCMSAKDLNKWHLEKNYSKIVGCCFIIEDAKHMTPDTIQSVLNMLDEVQDNVVTILIDARLYMKDLMNEYKMLKRHFPLDIKLR